MLVFEPSSFPQKGALLPSLDDKAQGELLRCDGPENDTIDPLLGPLRQCLFQADRLLHMLPGLPHLPNARLRHLSLMASVQWLERHLEAAGDFVRRNPMLVPAGECQCFADLADALLTLDPHHLGLPADPRPRLIPLADALRQLHRLATEPAPAAQSPLRRAQKRVQPWHDLVKQERARLQDDIEALVEEAQSERPAQSRKECLQAQLDTAHQQLHAHPYGHDYLAHAANPRQVDQLVATAWTDPLHLASLITLVAQRQQLQLLLGEATAPAKPYQLDDVQRLILGDIINQTTYLSRRADGTYDWHGTNQLRDYLLARLVAGDSSENPRTGQAEWVKNTRVSLPKPALSLLFNQPPKARVGRTRDGSPSLPEGHEEIDKYFIPYQFHYPIGPWSKEPATP